MLSEIFGNRQSGAVAPSAASAVAPQANIAEASSAAKASAVFSYCCPRQMNPPQQSELSYQQILDLFAYLDKAGEKGGQEEPKEIQDIRNEITQIKRGNGTLGALLKRTPLSDEDHSPLVTIFRCCVSPHFWPEGIHQILSYVAQIPALNMKKFINAKSHLFIELRIPNRNSGLETIRTLYPMQGTVLQHFLRSLGKLDQLKSFIELFIELGLNFDAKHECGLTALQISHLAPGTIHEIYDQIEIKRNKGRSKV